MKKINVLRIIIFLIFFINILCSYSFAVINWDGIDRKDPNAAPLGSEVAEIGSIVLTIVTNVGMIVSIAIISYLGIKYMTGSVEEKASYKSSMMPYLVGAVLTFGASTIAKILIELVPVL